jgi:hypothetical protein
MADEYDIADGNKDGTVDRDEWHVYHKNNNCGAASPTASLKFNMEKKMVGETSTKPTGIRIGFRNLGESSFGGVTVLGEAELDPAQAEIDGAVRQAMLKAKFAAQAARVYQEKEYSLDKSKCGRLLKLGESLPSSKPNMIQNERVKLGKRERARSIKRHVCKHTAPTWKEANGACRIRHDEATTASYHLHSDGVYCQDRSHNMLQALSACEDEERAYEAYWLAGSPSLVLLDMQPTTGSDWQWNGCKPYGMNSNTQSMLQEKLDKLSGYSGQGDRELTAEVSHTPCTLKVMKHKAAEQGSFGEAGFGGDTTNTTNTANTTNATNTSQEEVLYMYSVTFMEVGSGFRL